ncbi:hypothetical protein HNY73_020984 [Argiope bruennichi]|uniref:Uncharacterized protein n=1 Tax=Argiope bruennichi TaxID=94029 RepID=A0A8T0E8Q4_ARGBR|nr:hypothetical protein HNY73_020984 [Argiope bruennichi]
MLRFRADGLGGCCTEGSRWTLGVRGFAQEAYGRRKFLFLPQVSFPGIPSPSTPLVANLEASPRPTYLARRLAQKRKNQKIHV